MKEWKHDNITLLCADCMEVMRSASEPLAELAVCDPDYDLGKRLRGGTWADRYGDSGSKLGGAPTWEYFDELRRVTANQVIWGGNYFDFLPPTRCFLIWDKKDKMPKMADCEYAWTSFDRNAKVFSSARNPHGISGNDKRIHICQKPVQLYMWVYDLLAKPGDRVLDTHAGSASSAIAAWECNHPYIGIEINPDYFDKAVARIEKHIQTHPKLI